jgi:hypothetical protein
VKRLELVAARRTCWHDRVGVVSAGIEGRSGCVLLAARTEREAEDLVACIATILQAPSGTSDLSNAIN